MSFSRDPYEDMYDYGRYNRLLKQDPEDTTEVQRAWEEQEEAEDMEAAGVEL